VGSVRVYSDSAAARFIVREGGTAYISLPGTRRWRLCEDGGPYSAVPADEVLEALERVSYPLDSIEATIVILPFPRCDLLDSSAEGRVVFLSPGRWDVPREHVHYTVAHEIGHLVHNALMPDRRDDLWREYARLRGIDYEAARDARDHASRLHEIFAEDFRVLFGSDLARCGSGIENHDLPMPDAVPGLRDFFVSLSAGLEPRIVVSACPNPFGDCVRIETYLSGNVQPVDRIEIFDASGRSVVVLRPPAAGSAVTWDGRSAFGVPVVPGIYFVALRAGVLAEVHKVARIRN
jgi:hypothetical protein